MTTSDWGRVADDGTVYVKTADGERAVGQMPDATPEEALAFYTKRYDNLALEVDLLHRRVMTGVLSPEEAAQSVKLVREQLADVHAVGDLAALTRKLDELGPVIATQRDARKAAKAQRSAEARDQKAQLAAEAEKIAAGRDWRNGSGRYRDLMRDWKAAGPAPKAVDDDLWQRFRGAQDRFFGARDAANAALDTEFAANAEVKQELLVEAEAILGPLAETGDVAAAKAAFRAVADKWDEAGKVPRDRIKDLEGRMRAVENTIRKAEDDQWRRSDPEKSARADDMVSKLESAIAESEAKLESARGRGDDKRIRELESSIEGQRSLLEMAKRASADFS